MGPLCESHLPQAFTGDYLFAGSVGRPDLLGSVGYSKEAMAALLFDSLHDKLLRLPDDCVVYPAHGPGSPCGQGLSSDLSSTIGRERLTNAALQVRYWDEPLTQFILCSSSMTSSPS